MAYNEELAERIRAAIGDHPAVSEKKMFGGLAFLIGGNLAVAASGQGGLMVRVGPDQSASMVDKSGVAPMVMRGKELAGWVRVGEAVLDRTTLQQWVDVGVEYAGTLPAK